MNPTILLGRSKSLSLKVVDCFRLLPKTPEAQIMGRQLLRSSTSATANYRAACRSRSYREFLAKLSIVVEEMDETVLWLELLKESGVSEIPVDMLKEADELLRIFAASRKTARNKLASIEQTRNQNFNKSKDQ